MATLRLCVAVLCLLPALIDPSPANPYILEPVSVADSSGNSADGNSSVTWAALPTGEAYLTSTEYDDGGMGPLFDFARSFINTVAPQDPPWDILKGLLDGTVSLGDKYMDLIMWALGFAICFAIGILFIFIFTITGCCLCCCRCCCQNCGGKMMQKKDDNANCKRIGFSITNLILTVFMGVGAACVFVSAGRMTTALDNLDTAVDTNLDDITRFMNNLISELEFAAGTDYNFTVDVISRDLDNIGYLVGVPVVATLNSEGNIDVALNAMIAFQSDIEVVGDDLIAVNTSTATLKANGNTLQSNLSDVAFDITTAQGSAGCNSVCAALDPSLVAMDVNFDNLPDISSQAEQMEDVQSKNLTALVLEGKKQFDEIPEKVQNDTATTVSDTKDMLQSFSSTIDSQISSVKDMPTSLLSDVDGYRVTIGDYLTTARTYDKYRWYGGIGLACIVILIAVLQLLGVLFGCCGHRKEALPTERSCLSNSGGEMLMAASGFIFIFAWLLMLLTSISFLLGGNLEADICRQLNDEDNTLLKELVDGPGGLLANDGEYFLGATLLQNGSYPLTVSGVLDACEANTAAYTALELKSIFDLDTIVDYKSTIDIETTMDNINVDLSTVELLSAETEAQLRDFSDSTQIDYQGFKDELIKNTTKTNLTAFADSLRVAAADCDAASAAETLLTAAADDLDAIASGIYVTVNSDQTQLYDDIVSLETSTAAIPASVNNTIDAAQTSETFLQNNGSTLIKEEATTYANRLMGVADSFATFVLNAVKNDAGKCLPIYNLWESMLGIAFCKYTIDAFNGFWFSLGWSIFFMVPCVIFNIKLAKHFRKMKFMEDFDGPDGDPKTARPASKQFNAIHHGKSPHSTKPSPQLRSGDPPKYASNKIGHYDNGQYVPNNNVDF